MYVCQCVYVCVCYGHFICLIYIKLTIAYIYHVFVALGSALGQFRCCLGPSCYEYLVYSISINIVKGKTRIHLIIIISNNSSSSRHTSWTNASGEEDKNSDSSQGETDMRKRKCLSSKCQKNKTFPTLH